MNILFTRFPFESSYGGAEVQTLSLMEGLKKRGHDVLFLGSCPVLLDWMPELKITNEKLPMTKPPVTPWTAMSFLWRQFFMKYKLIHALKKLSADHCLSAPSAGLRTGTASPLACHGELDESIHVRCGAKTGQLTAILMLSLSEKLLLTPWAVKHGITVFWIEHDRIGRWLTQNPWRTRLRKLSKCVTTICVSELSRGMYIDLGWDPEKVVAIPNGIDEGRLDSAHHGEEPRTLACMDSSELTMTCKGAGRPTTPPLHIGCVARLSRDKGIDLLIKAIANIPTVHLTVVGRGSDEQFLTTLIEQTNVHCSEQRIVLRSFVEDLGAFYHSLDLLVLPSRQHDPFGLSAAEAMFCGIPVIVTDCCGIAGYLQNGIDALVTASNSDSALKEAILRMHDPNVRSRIAQEGQKTAREKFTIEKMTDIYEGYILIPCIPCRRDPGVSK